MEKERHPGPVGMEDADSAVIGIQIGPEGETPEIVGNCDGLRIGLGGRGDFAPGGSDGVAPGELKGGNGELAGGVLIEEGGQGTGETQTGIAQEVPFEN